jgi:3-oxoadipate enol-lactonase
MLAGSIERPGGRLHYEVSGRNHAPTLVLLHPLGASLGVWDTQMPQFEQFFRVLRFDARGHGKSTLATTPEPQFTIADLAADAIEILDALHIERAHWCGLSLGGVVALQAAINSPARVQRLVLANTAAHFPPPSMWDERRAIALSQGLAPLLEAVPSRWFTAPFRTAQPERVEALLELMRRNQPAGYAAACAALRDADLRGGLTGVRAPTLVIAGSQDAATPLERAEELCENISGADLLVLDAAHLSNVEQAEDFSRAVIDFLRD